MNIDDLNNPSVSEMSEEELRELLTNIRSNRRKQPDSKTTKSKTSGSKKNSGGSKKKDAKTKMLENLSAEERRKLLEELSNENGSS